MKLFVAFLALVSLSTAWKSYTGYQVLSIVVNTEEEVGAVYALAENEEHFDIWRDPKTPGDSIDIMVHPEVLDSFKAELTSRGFHYIVKNADVGKTVDEEKERMARRPKTHKVDYDDYLDLAGVELWIDEMAANFSFAEVFNAGTSYEGRTIRAVKMSTGGVGKKAAWIDSCIHSREWIACSSNMYQMQKLAEQYGVDPDVTTYLDNIDVYALPVFNVDGYTFSHTDDRYWRKTRSPNAGSVCIGTDPNRNWDIDFCQFGSSTSPCSDAYCGSAPFSEIEVDSVVNGYVTSIPNLQLYVAMHSYGNWWMTPWAYQAVPPSDHDATMAVCNNVASAIQSVNGQVFDCGTIASFVGVTSGSSVDFIKTNMGVPLNFAPELRGNDFVVDPRQIVPAGEECYAGLLEMLKAVYEA